MIVSGVGEPYLSALKRAGVLAHRWLPHGDYVKLVKASDAYFLPATSAYSYGGIGVAVMEAMAMGVPVVSPTLREFIDALTYVIENRELYKPWTIRELGRKYYSWESFVRDFDNVARKL
jgi:glycosyltransferase involved in cell wall biosynthesis